MGEAYAELPSARLKREDFHLTKHDTAFSKWRVLIGPTDWDDYEAERQGAERYRVANLPHVSAPGLYEIGVAVCLTHSGRHVSKLETQRIVVVYLGQADNVRSRLQHYGRHGSHLLAAAPDLFKDVFARGFPIVYRWASMNSKSEAERTEAQLLARFDYAWNKLGNGSRRPNDALMKMDKIASKNRYIPKLLKMLQALRDQRVGIPIKAEKLSLENKPNNHTNDENFNLLGRVLKFSRSRPVSVSADPDHLQDFSQTVICGVTCGDGTTCTKPPVEGRKRCAEHKGRRLTGQMNSPKDLGINGIQEKQPSFDVADNTVSKDSLSPVCGVTQHDGSPCQKPPVPGRKRCLEHKGMRVNHASPKLLNSKSVIERPVSDLGLADICGVNLGEGKCCTRQPVKGRKRCKEHKGMRVDRYVSKLSSKWSNAELGYSFSCPLSEASTAHNSNV